MKSELRLNLFCLGAVLLPVVAGCSDGGIPRFQVSGTVNYMGKPVPSGKITFQPDRSTGNQGPSSTALITEGRYETPYNKGVVGGSQEVTIYGYDGSPPSEPLPFGKPIFAAYQTTIDIADEDTSHDFEVPQER